MFGRGNAHGEATIVARELDSDVHRYGVNVEVATDRYHSGYRYIADIAPEDGGEAFRATFRARFSHTGEFHEPHIGERVRVSYNAKSREDVEFDRDVLRALAAAERSGDRSAFDAIADAPPGTPPPAPGQT